MIGPEKKPPEADTGAPDGRAAAALGVRVAAAATAVCERVFAHGRGYEDASSLTYCAEDWPSCFTVCAESWALFFT